MIVSREEAEPLAANPSENGATDVPPVRLYDAFAWLYDLVVGSELYHRVMWGMPPREHGEFAQRALRSAPAGRLLDAGCGSLLFTQRAYLDSARELTLVDASPGMLARARRRIGGGRAADRFSWVRADLLSLPLPDSSVAGVLHFGVLHCLPQPQRALAQLRRVTRPEGSLFLSCLVLGRARGDRFLRALHRKGHIARPRTPEEVCSFVEGAGFEVEATSIKGSFLFLEGRARAREAHPG